jgi:hypothetical protein
MEDRRVIKVYSAGCPLCQKLVALVKSIACSSCDVRVLDMSKKDIAARAKQLTIGAVPAVVVDGELVECCVNARPKSDGDYEQMESASHLLAHNVAL